MSKSNLVKQFTLFILLVFFAHPAFSQTIELDVQQNFNIPNSGFFAFSDLANAKLKDIFPTNPNLEIEFSNVFGSPCGVAPAADFAEIGPQIVVNANGTITVDFSMASSNVSLFGLSLVPQGGACIFNILPRTPQIPVVTTSSSSSSSGGSISVKSNRELIQEAIDLETDAQDNDLTLESPTSSIESVINQIDTSLSNLNSFSNSINGTRSLEVEVQKKTTCAINNDKKAKAILTKALNKEQVSLIKVKKFLKKALRCKKFILEHLAG